jgi:hypothetical protein
VLGVHIEPLISHLGALLLLRGCHHTACRFELAIQLGDLETAADIAKTLDTPAKWRQLGAQHHLDLHA